MLTWSCGGRLLAEMLQVQGTFSTVSIGVSSIALAHSFQLTLSFFFELLESREMFFFAGGCLGMSRAERPSVS